MHVLHDQLHKHLIEILTQTDDTHVVIDLFQNMVDKQGTHVYSQILNTLTSLELNEQDAKKHWEQIVRNWQDLSEQLGRKIGLQTAVCDYFTSIHNTLKSPKIIDIRLYEKTVLNTYVDNLTGLYNRRYADEILNLEVAYAKRHNLDLSLLFFDIDNFKDVNDTFGHDAGDLFLHRVADIINKTKRVEDIACRFGGEEMLLILRETDGISALIIGQRILKKVADLKLEYQDQTISTTISAGLASYPLHGETSRELLISADAALYQAKGAGKNAITCSSIDKRRSLRVDLSVPIMMKEFSFTDENKMQVNANNISLGGFSFQTNSQLQLGMKIQVELLMPEQKPLQLIANIVRIDEISQGNSNIGAELCFKQMNKSCHNTIAAYVSGNGKINS